MKFSRIAPLSALAAVMIAAIAFAPARALAQTGKIAVANPARIFNELQETKDLKVAIETERGQLEKMEIEKRAQIKDLQGRRDQLKSDSAAWADANRDLMQKGIEFEVWGRTQQANMQSRQKIQMMNLFLKITTTVQEVATSKQIDLVIAEQRPEFPENLDQLNPDQLRALINSRNVLFAATTVDISNDVIAAMDAKYKAGK